MALVFTEQAQKITPTENPSDGSQGSSGDASDTGANDSSAAAQGKDDNINQASVNAEAWVATGGYDPSIATAVASSGGVGVDSKDVEKAAADFAREADRAVRDGQTLEQVRTADPNLSHQAQQEIYAKVAQEHGTSEEEITKHQAEQLQQVQQALWGRATGLVGALDAITGKGEPPMEKLAAAASRDKNTAFAGLLEGIGRCDLGSDCKDMGPTTTALAASQFTPTAIPGQDRDRGAGLA
jgi:hypothetical protein